MRKSLVALAGIAVLTMLASAAVAQWPGRSTPNILGIYTAQDGATGLANLDIVGGSTTIYLIASNVDGPGGIGGWECQLVGDWDTNDDIFSAGHTLSGNALNVSAFPDFSVGLGTPINPDANGNIVLANFSFIFFSQQMMELFLAPSTVASVPGQMVYAAGDNPGLLIPFVWSSGNEALPVFGFNTGPLSHEDGGTIPTEPTTMGNVKALYR